MIIILTATVRPFDLVNTERSSEKERIRQYEEAISGWINIAAKLDASLIIVENSGFRLDLNANANAAGAMPIWLEAPSPSSRSRLRGKGHMEAEMLMWALPRIGATPQELVWKATGRTLLKNWKILDEDAFPDMIVADLPRSHFDWVPTRIFGTTYELWPSLAKILHSGTDDRAVSKNIENLLAKVCNERLRSGNVTTFRSQPEFIGSSGTTGLPLSTSRPRPIKWAGSQVRRSLFRGLQTARRNWKHFAGTAYSPASKPD